jgi:membrane-bound metal-dependent hydrolase YbcI (DUF457 family)
MMGQTHALTGLAAGIGATYLVTLSVPAAVLGTIVCAGAAILPDIDHPKSTISNTYGPITRGFSWIMRHATGGHRRGTHSLAGILALGFVAQAGVMYRHAEPLSQRVPAQIALTLVTVLALAGAIRLLKIDGWLDDVLPVPIVAGVVALTDIPMDIVPPALMLGAAVHVIGDIMTMSPCQILWPLDDHGVKLSLFKTNGRVERWIVKPVVIVGIVAELLWKVVDATGIRDTF